MSTSTPFQKSWFTKVVDQMRERFTGLTDKRTGDNSQYGLCDAALSAFSVFFLQCASFLEFQRRMQLHEAQNNMHTLFGAFQIPCDNQIRNLLDAVEPKELDGMYDFMFDGLQTAGVLEQYRFLQGRLLLALDGVTYFSSDAVHCKQCSERTHVGKTSYHHSVVTPVLVCPGQDKVVCLPPEFIVPQDGNDKQDCELQASQRWLQRHGARYAGLGTVVLGDDLYCHEPFCRALREQSFEFVLVCKPSSHPTTYEWLEMLQKAGQVHSLIKRRWTGLHMETDTYQYASSVPLRDGDDALMVDWCELRTTDETGKLCYHNSFVSSLPVTQANVVEVVAAGRARWKIENENNNTLKTRGYHFEHNFGHGHDHLASVLLSLVILAFLLHTMLQWLDERFKVLRSIVPSRKVLFNDLRALASYLHFPSWSALVEFMISGWSQSRKSVRLRR